MKQKLKYRGLGIEPKILKELKKIARIEDRTVNQLINRLLKQALKTYNAL